MIDDNKLIEIENLKFKPQNDVTYHETIPNLSKTSYLGEKRLTPHKKLQENIFSGTTTLIS